MSKTLIYYFSGTGNCRATAKQLAEELGGEVTAITAALVEQKQPIECDTCIVITPAYGYGMPKIMYRFYKEITIKADYLAALVTYGSQPGSTLLHAKRLCRRRGQKSLDYAGKIKSVENYIPIFGCKSQEKIDKLIPNQRELTSQVAADIRHKKIKNKLFGFRPFTHLISVTFRAAIRLLTKGYKVTDACTKCGICRDVCPASAITIENDSKPKFNNKRCEQCQACLNFCPHKAIKFLRMKPTTRRYHHPDVTVKEMKDAVADKTEQE